jgi:diguanylate cyclase (GGDEF)-like protein
VRTKLLLVVLVLAAVAIGVGGLSLNQLRQVQRAGDDVYTWAMRPALHASDIELQILAKRNTALRHASAPDAASKRKYEALFRTYAADLDRALATYPVAEPVDAERISLIAGLTSEYNAVLLGEYMPASLRFDAVAVQRARDRASPLGDQSLVVLEDIIAEQNQRAVAIRQAVTDEYAAARAVVIAVLLVGLSAGLLLGLAVARVIVRRLHRVQWVAEGLAAGDLSRSSGVTGTDEIARMAIALDEAVRTRSRLERELLERNAELLRLSTTDLLTGLPNRRHLEQRLTESVSLATRHRCDLSVLLFDVDRFKQINDRLGHHAGDLVLAAVADRIRSAMRTEDLAGRWGGEEFLAVLPNTDLDGAFVAGERIRTLINGEPIALDGHEPLTVTVSVGAAAGPADGLDGLLRRADEAMYEAKETGRDRVVCAARSVSPDQVAHLGAG